MSLVNLKLANTEFTLNSNDPQKTLLMAERFNQRMKEVANQSSLNVPDYKLALITSLILEDELHALEETLKLKQETHSSDEANTINVMGETLDQVSLYLEKLADEIEKS